MDGDNSMGGDGGALEELKESALAAKADVEEDWCQDEVGVVPSQTKMAGLWFNCRLDINSEGFPKWHSVGVLRVSLEWARPAWVWG